MAEFTKSAEEPPKPANAPLGSVVADGTDLAAAAAVGDPGPALARPDVDPAAEAALTAGRSSECTPWREAIRSRCSWSAVTRCCLSSYGFETSAELDPHHSSQPVTLQVAQGPF